MVVHETGTRFTKGGGQGAMGTAARTRQAKGAWKRKGLIDTNRELDMKEIGLNTSVTTESYRGNGCSCP